MGGLLTFQISGQESLEKFITDLPGIFDTTAILDEGAAVLYNRIRTHFLQEVSPSGEKWPTSKAAMHRSTIGRGGGTLFDTGKLFHSLQLFSDSPTTRSIGTDATSGLGFPYSIVHQFGLGNQVRREFIGFGPEDVFYMSNLVITRISERLGIT